MADAANSISGKLVILSIATNLTTPVYKTAVCLVDKGLTGSANVVTQETSCGTAKSRGTANRTVTASLVGNSAPSGTEMSIDDFEALFTNGTPFLWKLDDGVDYYRAGQGFLGSYNENANVNDPVRADLVIEVQGDVDSSR